MCGIIFVYSEEPLDPGIVDCSLHKLGRRGPEMTKIVRDFRYYIGFKRLCINGLSEEACQPIDCGDHVVVCNGEIYNHTELDECKSGCDCEVIPKLLQTHTLEETYHKLRGEFVFAGYNKKTGQIYAARDPYGVRPLFGGARTGTRMIAFASEAKALVGIADRISVFPPGCIWDDVSGFKKVYDYELVRSPTTDVFARLKGAVQRRMVSTDRPFGALLSGGLDSSTIVSVLSELSDRRKFDVFTIQLGPSSPDTDAAIKVASQYGLRHHIVKESFETAWKILPLVIYATETFDTTTIRASTPQFLLARYIAHNTDIKVLFSGEGSDELTSGYQYFKMAPSAEESHLENIRLLEELYLYDNLRTDRTTAFWGLEVRVPFLDPDFVSGYLGIDPEQRYFKSGTMEKQLLRKMVESGTDLDPEIIWRRKEAFSDAVGYGWVDFIKDRVDSLIPDSEFENCKTKYTPVPLTKEAYYYRTIYEQWYSDILNVSHYWMPRWVQAKDPSARVLECYQTSG